MDSAPPGNAQTTTRKRVMFEVTKREGEIMREEDDITFSKAVKAMPNPLGGLVFLSTTIHFIKEDRHFRRSSLEQETPEALLKIFLEHTGGHGEAPPSNALPSPP